jgi:hypothetical protein
MSRNIQTSHLLAIVVASAMSFATDARAQQDGAMRWSITPYIWAPTTKVDLSFGDTSAGGTIRIKDIIDSIDSAFLVSVEAGKGHWSAFGDFMIVDASDVTERPLVSVESRNKQQFIDIALSWWPGGIEAPFSLFGGLRYTGFDNRYEVVTNQAGTILLSGKSDPDYYDALLGLRYRFDLSERWALLTRADASFGDSDGTLMLRANFAYTVGKRQQNRILVGYQYKEADFDDNGLETAFEFSGFLAGFNFRF